MKYLKFLAGILLCCTSTAIMGCSSDSSDDVTKQVPKVVSTSPENGATEVETGDLDVVINYDMNVSFVSSKSSSISMTGGTLSRTTVSGKSLYLKVNCPDKGTLVTINLPAGLVTSSDKVDAPAYTMSFTTKAAAPVPQDGHETAAEAVAKMGPGWNLGNSLDAWSGSLSYGLAPSSYETCWGQPVTDAHLIKAFKEKGFGAIRIPVTWFQNMDENDIVSETWMARVEEVVNYVLNQGMYCILNVHHDTGAGSQAWLKADNTTYAAVSQRYESLWTQIANRFKDYDEKLLFEGYNEMLAGTDPNAQWSEPKSSASYEAINKFAQLFVTTVRATGGNNQYRNLIVTTYSAAHTKNTLAAFTVPTDPCGNQNHLAVEVHSYDPWNWVNTYNMKWTSACTAELESMFSDLNTTFIQNGYPVIVGEYGSNGDGEKTINGSSTSAQKAEAGRQGADMSRLARKYNAAAFYWMGLIEGKDRSEATFKWTMEQVADSIVNVYK